jgi:hypothetical protein
MSAAVTPAVLGRCVSLAFGSLGAGLGTSVAPQPLQKREPGGGVAPQLAQTTVSLAPQPLQKTEPAGGSWPQLAQVTR